MDADHQSHRSGAPPHQAGATSNRRRWLLRGMAVALSLSPLVLLEIALRFFTAPAAAVDLDPLVDLHQLRPLFVLNETVGRWEIPEERFNFFQPDSFLADKAPGSRRVFVLGGSTVQGRPFSIETSFACWLKLRLQAAHPQTKLEVINCGGVSYASYRVGRIVDEVLAHQPDAIVIYTGHNEFLEDREYADFRAMSRTRRLLAQAASNLRTVTWIRSKLSKSSQANSLPPNSLRPNSLRPNSLAAEVDARLDHVGGLDRYHRDPGWRSGVENHFARTLRQMVTAVKRANVPLVLCVPASDLVNTPPFKIEQATWDESSPQANAFRDAWSIAQDNLAGTSERLSACAVCLGIDPEHAGANYIAGRLHYDRGDSQVASRYLSAARDFDVCPLRATTPIVKTVFDVATEHRVPLVNTLERLDQRDSTGKRIPDAIADPEFFVDHVHPTVAGHQEIGAAIAAELGKLGWFTPTPVAEENYQSLVEAHLASLGEDYYARGRQRLEGLRRWAAGRAGKLVPTKPAENALD